MQKKQLNLLVKRVTHEAERINSYELVDPHGAVLPSFAAGSHLDLRLPNGQVRQYSLCNDPDDEYRYVIGVLKEVDGRGGSKIIHDSITAGMIVNVSSPRNNFALCEEAEHHVLVAGGIGITPLKSMLHRLERIGANYTMHYCVRSAAHLPFRGELLARSSEGRVLIHYDEGFADRRLDIASILQERVPGAHLYFCGPRSMMQACTEAASAWPSESVHFEHFAAPVDPGLTQTSMDGNEFTVRLVRSCKNLRVPAESSIAEVLQRDGQPVETSCKSGLCGACRVGYLSGKVDHRDFILSESERENSLTTCVSRSLTPILELDL